MKKKIKSAVISIAVIAVLLLSILIGVKNGTLDKLTKEMPTLATSQEETEKTTVNVKNDSTESKPYEGIEIAGYGEEFLQKSLKCIFTFHILHVLNYHKSNLKCYCIIKHSEVKPGYLLYFIKSVNKCISMNVKLS